MQPQQPSLCWQAAADPIPAGTVEGNGTWPHATEIKVDKKADIMRCSLYSLL